MLEVYQRIDTPLGSPEPDIKLLLSFDQRSKARLKTISTEGHDVGLFLDHGHQLGVGEYLQTSCGKTVRIDGAIETVLVAKCDDWVLFSRACYHLGNRHVKIQIVERTLRITPDHVLGDMLTGLGLEVSEERCVFIPENGAYHSDKNSAKDTGHTHNHGPAHEH